MSLLQTAITNGRCISIWELHCMSLLLLYGLKKIGSYNIYIYAIFAYMEMNTFYKKVMMLRLYFTGRCIPY
jgi:hypothetical protein